MENKLYLAKRLYNAWRDWQYETYCKIYPRWEITSKQDEFIKLSEHFPYEQNK